MRRLVVALPDVSCVRCGVTELPWLRHAHPADDGQPIGACVVQLSPPPGWTELSPRERSPDGQPARTFLICGACYARGASQGYTLSSAHVEDAPK